MVIGLQKSWEERETVVRNTSLSRSLPCIPYSIKDYFFCPTWWRDVRMRCCTSIAVGWDKSSYHLRFHARSGFKLIFEIINLRNCVLCFFSNVVCNCLKSFSRVANALVLGLQITSVCSPFFFVKIDFSRILGNVVYVSFQKIIWIIHLL